MGWGSGIAKICGFGCRCGLDPMLLWLWWRLAAVGLIQPLAWELPCTTGAALKQKKKKKTMHYLIIIIIILPYLWHMEGPRPEIKPRLH